MTKFENKESILRFNVRRYVVVLVFIPVICFILWGAPLFEQLKDINKPLFLTIASAGYLLFVIYNYLMNYTYLFFKEEESKLIIRFISMRPFDNRRSSIEVTKENFLGFEEKKSFLNLKHEIIIKIKTPKGPAKYPPISLIALSKEKKKLFFKVLSDHSQL